MQQWKSDFKRTINWLKYKSNVTIQAPNPYLDYLIDPDFQGVNRAFVLLFENTTDRTVDTTFYLPTLEIENYNVMIDGKNLFDQPVKNNIRQYDNTSKIATGQGDDYTTSCPLHYNYFSEDLSNQ